MCGINGILSYNSSINIRDSISKMNSLLKHRGPDADGNYFHKNLGLGHTRLSIIDLSSDSNQPFIYKNFSIVYNGEVYNFKELRKNLASKGYQFKTNSDTEVVLKMYIEYKDEFVNQLNGIFSIAIYDSYSERLMLVRDRLGVKPLYYRDTKDSFCFSSEIKPILKVQQKFEVNEEVLPHYFQYRYVPGTKTIFKGINSLGPGEILIINKNKEKTKYKYWDLTKIPETNYSKNEVREKFSSLFSESCKIQMLSDVPVGLLMSSGVDSVSIASEVSKLNPGIDTYTMDLNTKNDESKKAKEIALALNLNHKTVTLKGNDFNLYSKAILALEEPLGDSIISATYALAKEVSKDKKVILSGEGADEVLNGYIHHLLLLSEDKLFKYLPKSMINFSGAMLKFCPQALLESIFPYPSKIGASGKLKVSNHLKKWDNSFRAYDSLANMFDRDFNDYIKLQREISPIEIFFKKSNYGLQRTLTSNDLLYWNSNYTLHRLDKLTMAHGLEARVPFLDHRIVELFVGNKKNYNQYGFKQKLILREHLRKNSTLPPDVINQKKQAFFLPPEESFESNEYQEWLRDIMSEQAISMSKYFDKKAITYLRDKSSPSLLESKRLTSIAMYFLWEREFKRFMYETNV